MFDGGEMEVGEILKSRLAAEFIVGNEFILQAVLIAPFLSRGFVPLGSQIYESVFTCKYEIYISYVMMSLFDCNQNAKVYANMYI